MEKVLKQTFEPLGPPKMEYQTHTFSNGIRLIHKEASATRIVHCGFIFDVGSRDEDHVRQGLAHFWEHMAFKGTEKRKAFHILNRLEILGGELNAYTTKEKIAFHASILHFHFKKAVELLTDIAFHSIFPQKEIEKERGVVLEEMAMYEDSPDDAIQDEFDSLLFSGHTLGNNILGTEESIQAIKREDFFQFISECVATHKIAFSVVGPFSFQQALDIAGPFLAAINPKNSKPKREKPEALQTENRVVKKTINQAHLMIGCRSFSLKDENRLPFFLLNNLLGGPAFTSRLNMALRERSGLVYSVESQYSPYLDCGAFSVYLATEARNLKKAEDLVHKEIAHLWKTPLTQNQLKLAKEQLKGQLAMAEESNQAFMLMMGKSLLDMDKVESLPEIFHQIGALSSEQLQIVAKQVWDQPNWVRLSYLPEA